MTQTGSFVLYRHTIFWYVLTVPDPTKPDGESFRRSFFAKHPSAETVLELFEHLPSVFFYAKDDRHRYIDVNRATLEGVFGLTSKSDLLGRTDASFQLPALAEAYHAEDRRVMDGGRTIANQVWLVPHVVGTPRWYVSTKTPLRDPAGHVIGLAGVMYPIETPEEEAKSFRELAGVIRYVDDHYNTEISMSEMAAMVNLSSTQLNAKFREMLRISPTEYVLSRRIQHACRLLVETSSSLAEVGVQVGFFDQSHFTKRFRKVTGITPRAYRERFRKD